MSRLDWENNIGLGLGVAMQQLLDAALFYASVKKQNPNARITVTGLLKPDPAAQFSLPNGKVLTTRDRVVTYVARELEPYRGFPTMMRSAALLCEQGIDCDIVIVGGDGVSYGAPPADAPDWRSRMLAEVKVDPDRVHFLGKIPYEHYRRLLQVSSAHVYLTYPFVLSWSMLEAMASGCVVIGSSTPPVQEVIKDGDNGLLVDFFAPEQLARTVAGVLDTRHDMHALRTCARATVVERFSIEQGIRGYRELIEESTGASLS